MNIEKRQALERKVVRHLIRTAVAAGWAPTFTDDGGDELVTTKSETSMMEAVFSVDDCWVFFTKVLEKPIKLKRCGVRIVLGNDGYDAIADYHAFPQFEKEVMEASNAYCDSLSN